MQDDRLPVSALPDVARRVQALDGLGLRVTRVDVLWEDVAPTRPADGADPGDPAYDWRRLDAIVDGLAARDIAVILSVYRTPEWSNGGHNHRYAPELPYYADLMTALATRYDGRTRDAEGRTHGPVEMFEAWNEPNISGFLWPQWRTTPEGAVVPASPGIYAGLLEAAYASVKAVQPDAWVIGLSGGPSGGDRPPNGSVGIVRFIRELAERRPPADAWAQHLYPATGPGESTAMPSFRRLSELIDELDRVRPDLPVLITEFGWLTRGTAVRPSHVSEEEQAAHLREAVDALAAMPRVRLAVWFQLQDNALWTSGLLREDESPKPAWEVFRALPRFIAPAGAEPAPAEPAPAGAEPRPVPGPAPAEPVALAAAVAPAAPSDAVAPNAVAPAAAPRRPDPAVRSLAAAPRIRAGRPVVVRVRFAGPPAAPVQLERRTRRGWRTVAVAAAGTPSLRLAVRAPRAGVMRLRVRSGTVLSRVVVVRVARADAASPRRHAPPR